ncbi:MAG: diguanylate cyclase [Myxococcota bacterium]|jgi:diguanylate cyclase (GGDEF)-like protein|nr:diguanylate cyclase [Myxococcota bacterium]
MTSSSSRVRLVADGDRRARSWTEPGTVLVVEDDRLSARLTRRLLEALDHRVRVAHTPGSALEQMNDEVDVILLDVEMPDLDGPRLLPLLRGRSRSFVPCVFLTGRDDDDVRLRCMDAGGDDFLSKSTRSVELGIRISSMLRIRRLTRELERRAHVDPLSGVGNRNALEIALDERASEALRYGRPLAILIADIDFFKRVNDQRGHAAGDEVIRLLGDTLQSGTRDADRVFRYGGEEFVVLAPETGAEGARLLAERLAIAFREVTSSSPFGRQTVSIGVAAASLERRFTPRELLAAADRALYVAKANGRDCVIVDEDRRERRTEPAPARVG